MYEGSYAVRRLFEVLRPQYESEFIGTTQSEGLCMYSCVCTAVPLGRYASTASSSSAVAQPRLLARNSRQ